MVIIKPFRGFMYNQAKVDDLNSVVTPPYDVISEDERKNYFNRSKFNFTRLILRKEGAERYNNAATLLNDWIDENVLTQDTNDAIYVYTHSYKINGKKYERLSFISLLKLEELGKGVLPHEKTMNKPFKDRLCLLEATHANLGQVFLLYDDREKKIDYHLKKEVQKREAEFQFVDDDKVVHKVWKITDTDTIGFITQKMKQYQCIIADGHHRYKVALNFAKEYPELKDAQYRMITFCNSFQEGMTILPVNRIVYNLENINIEDFLAKISMCFDVSEEKNIHEMIAKLEATPVMIDKTQNLKNHVLGLHCNLNNTSYFLKLKDRAILDKFYKNKTDIYKKLDLIILNKLIFDEILGICKEDRYQGKKIEFVKGTDETIEKLRDKKYQFGFFVNAPLMREIFLMARADETMPQKSTYFYPKIYSGIVLRKMEK